MKTFNDFDGRYTAPLHGFRDAQDYWDECSSNRYLHAIRLPVWIVNALNDSFLPISCYPDFAQHGNPSVQLITPEHGGHCGFSSVKNDGLYWSEKLAVDVLAFVQG